MRAMSVRVQDSSIKSGSKAFGDQLLSAIETIYKKMCNKHTNVNSINSF